MILKLLLGKALLNLLDRMAAADEREKDVSGSELRAPDSEAAEPDPEPAQIPLVYPRVQRKAMGSLFEVYLAGRDRESLLAAGEEALDQVERLEGQLSHYRADSDVARLNANASDQWVRVEPRLFALLSRCLRWSAELDGAFDITAGPLVKAWGFFRGEGRIPSNEELAGVMEQVGFYRVVTDEDDNLIRFATPGLEINLGAVGKGYAIDEAAELLRFWGVKSAVLHGGQSTIYALGEPLDGEEEPGMESEAGWPFVVKDPRDHETPLQTVYLRDQALSTSGNYEQFFEHEGVRYGHIIDPLTGRPTQGMISVSVVSDSAAESDALSTAFFVLGREATQEYCADHPNIRVVMVEEAPEGEITVTRIGFESSNDSSE